MSFPQKILNNLSSKLKSAETLVETEMKNFQVVEEYEAKMRESSSQTPRASAQYQETATPLLANRSVQTLVAQAINQASQTEPIDENSLLRDEVDRLRKVMAELVHENNRYHFKLSNCTCCLSDDAYHDVSTSSFNESIRASTPLDFNLPSSDPPSLPSSVPAVGLMSNSP